MSDISFSVDEPVDSVSIYQPIDGFRYGSEAFWLAGLAVQIAPGAKRAVDLGTGSGIVGALLAFKGLSVTGLDVRPEWVPYWNMTLSKSSFAGTLKLELSDVSVGWSRPKVDLVVSNPPFFRAGSGPVSPNPWKAAARSEESAPLSDFVRTGVQALTENGALVFVLPIVRREEFEQCVNSVGWSLNLVVIVGEKRCLLVAQKRKGECEVRRISDRGPEVASLYATFS